MDALAANWHARLADFKEKFPQAKYEVAISFFHMSVMGLKGKRLLEYINYFLEGRSYGFDYVDCIFPTKDSNEQRGVKFSEDFTFGDEDSTAYRESIVPFSVFLDMLRICAKWHLHQFPEDENLLLHHFHERNLAMRLDGSDFPNQDNAETWWRKCNETRIYHYRNKRT